MPGLPTGPDGSPLPWNLPGLPAATPPPGGLPLFEEPGANGAGGGLPPLTLGQLQLPALGGPPGLALPNLPIPQMPMPGAEFAKQAPLTLPPPEPLTAEGLQNINECLGWVRKLSRWLDTLPDDKFPQSFSSTPDAFRKKFDQARHSLQARAHSSDEKVRSNIHNFLSTIVEEVGGFCEMIKTGQPMEYRVVEVLESVLNSYQFVITEEGEAKEEEGEGQEGGDA